MTAEAAVKHSIIHIAGRSVNLPILIVTAPDAIAIRSGTMIEAEEARHTFDEDTPVAMPALVPGRDYGVTLDNDGNPVAIDITDLDVDTIDAFAGFHYAPSGNAIPGARKGGDGKPAINPFSCWDAGFRPDCPDPRGMTLVERDTGARFWADIYLLGTEHHRHGTSSCGANIADGIALPFLPDGSGRASRLDYATAVDIYARHGKQLLGAEEFFAAAYGVTERAALGNEPETTGDIAHAAERFVSARGLFGATGTMWQWGTDGHPDDPRPSVFGGSWLVGSDAGSRYALLDFWPEDSDGLISARGRCDHLQPE